MGITRRLNYCNVFKKDIVCKKMNTCKRYISKQESEKINPDFVIYDILKEDEENCRYYEEKI